MENPFLTCKNCNKRYNISNRIPKILQCKHSLCFRCIKKDFEQNSNIKCSVCSQITKTHPNDLEVDIEKIYHTDEAQNASNLQSLQEVTKEKEVKQVEQTQVKQKAPAKKEQQQQQLSTCQLHNKKNTLFCLTCLTPICEICATYGNHESHKQNIFDYFKASNQFRIQQAQLLYDCEEKIKFLRQNAFENITILTKLSQDIRSQYDQYSSDAKRLCESIIQLTQQNLESWLQTSNRKIQFITSKLKERVESNQEVLEYLKDYNEPASNNILDLLDYVQKVEKYKKEVNKEPQFKPVMMYDKDIQNKLDFLNFIFTLQIGLKQLNQDFVYDAERIIET